MYKLRKILPSTLLSKQGQLCTHVTCAIAWNLSLQRDHVPSLMLPCQHLCIPNVMFEHVLLSEIWWDNDASTEQRRYMQYAWPCCWPPHLHTAFTMSQDYRIVVDHHYHCCRQTQAITAQISHFYWWAEVLIPLKGCAFASKRKLISKAKMSWCNPRTVTTKGSFHILPYSCYFHVLIYHYAKK